MKKQNGQTLVELLTIIGLSAIMLPALATGMFAAREGRAQETNRLQASALLNEAEEAVRSVREKGWTQFAQNNTYYPTVSGTGDWVLNVGSQAVGKYTRSVTIADVQRNASGQIVLSGGTVDPSTKKVTTTISWNTPIPSSVSNDIYFERYLSNQAWTQTSDTNFNAGTKTNTAVVAGALPSSVTFVQTAGSTNNASATSIAQAFSSNLAAGNLIIAAVSWGGDASLSCSDSQGNSYAVVTSQYDATNNRSLGICYAISNNGGATTTTATFSSAQPNRRILVAEYSGVRAVSPVDVTSLNLASGTTATSNAATTTTNGDLIFGAVMIDDPLGPTSITAGAGFTQRNSLNGKDLAIQDQVQSTAGSIASTQTFGAQRAYLAQMVAFKPITSGSGDAHVELAAGSGGPVTWGSPTLSAKYDLPGSITNATDLFVDTTSNRAYLAVGTTLRILDVSNPESTPTLLGTFTAAGTINDVYVAYTGATPYAYLATTGNIQELTIVNVSNPASLTSTVVNVADNADALSVFVTGGFAYVGKVVGGSGINEFFLYDVATPTAPVLTGSLNLSGNVNAIYVSGNFAFLATSIGTAELTVVNVAVKNFPSSATTANPAGTVAANDVFFINNVAYLVKGNDISGPEFISYNFTPSPTALSARGSYEAGAALTGIHVSSDSSLAFLSTAITNAQFRVLDLLNTAAAPSVEGSLNLGVTANGIMQAGSYAYLASTDDVGELTIVKGTAGGGGYQPSGTFESPTFDCQTLGCVSGVSAAYNRIDFTITKPTSTNVRFQIATNNNGSTWNFVGPDGTAASFYDNPQSIRIGTLGRYIRYRATLTSNPGNTATPAINDVSINFSP